MTMTTALSLFELFRQFDSLNHKAILETLCKMDPKAFQAAVRGTKGPLPWMQEVVQLLQHSSIVPAIKTIREATGMGLKESKDVVDALRGQISMNGSAISQVSRDTFNLFEQAGLVVHMLPAVPVSAADLKGSPSTLGELLQAKMNKQDGYQEPVTMVYIVREGCDNSIDTVFYSQENAEARKDSLNRRYPSSNHYVALHPVE